MSLRRTGPHRTGSHKPAHRPASSDHPLGWLRALALGMRFALAGGRDNTARTVLTAVGTGLGVAMLLLASSVPTARQHRDDRIHSRIDYNLEERGISASRGTVLVSDIDTVFRGQPIRGRLVEPEGPNAPLPPGLDRYPRPGEMVVSPALRKLLEAPGSGLLRDRLNHPAVGTIDDRGLLGPGEHVYFLGGEHMADGVAGARRLDHFGKVYPRKPLDPELILLTVAGIVALLTPVGVFLAAAARFGGERRDRRLAALRLIGADRTMTTRIAAGEALTGSALGVLAGAAFFLAGRQLVERVNIQGLNVFVQDLTPQPLPAAFVVLVVPVLSLAVTRLAMNKAVTEPMGVVRESGGTKRRLWWRIVLPALGLVLLQTSARKTTPVQDTAAVTAVITGMLAMLIGVTAVLPWLLERVTRLAGGSGPVSWQLAIRRMQLSSESSTRPVNGIVVAVAGAIALQILFTGIATSNSGGRESTAHDGTASGTRLGLAQLKANAGNTSHYAKSFASTPGVQQAIGFAELLVDQIPGSYPQTVRIADCAELRLLAKLAACSNGDAFLVTPQDAGADDMTTWKSGATMRMEGGTHAPLWKVPRITATAHATGSNPQGEFPERMLLATPGAVGATALAHSTGSVSLTYSTAQPDVQDLIRTTGAKLDPRFSVAFPTRAEGNPALAAIKRALLAGVAAALLLIAASMLVSALEQTRDRKRLLAMLVALGTRRRTLGCSLLWQTVLPVAAGLLVAAPVGTILGSALLGTVGRTATFDWDIMLAITGFGATAVVVVTLLTLPALRRATKSDELRHE
ncbi:FtsX-like permease family protein [Streptomyces sp. NPDC087769]|uniref:FtsX-like permease family protein n=1 Tax=Streptomyces sp. NPDC087769 TaxID=3365802 RepID=UPI00380FD7EE